MRCTCLAAIAAILLVVFPRTLFAERSLSPVAPGIATGTVVIDERCPTFHWGTAPEATSVELAVYPVPSEPELLTDFDLQPVIEISLPGGATGWTPPSDLCLERGEKYAWSVRPLYEDDDSVTWSEARVFTVAQEASDSEIEAAVTRVLERFLAEGRIEQLSPLLLTESRNERMPAAASKKAEDHEASKSVQDLMDPARADAQDDRAPRVIPGDTAIRGSIDEGLGVVGQANSVDGLGGYFHNTGGGHHLAAGGSSYSNPDFLVDVAGNVIGLTFNGDGSGLSGVNADLLDGMNSSAFGDIKGVVAGSGLDGGGTAGTVMLNIGTGAVLATHLANSSVVGGAGGDIADGTITYQDTNVNSVQRRVGGACGSSSSIDSISNSGAVACEYDDFNQVGLSDVYHATAYNGATNFAIVDATRKVCFLTRVQLRDVDAGGEDASCTVYYEATNPANTWVLQASSEDDSDAFCSMRCVTWSHSGRSD